MTASGPARLLRRRFLWLLVGTGIGLSISRNVVEADGGTITLVTEPASPGVTFEIRLPVACAS